MHKFPPFFKAIGHPVRQKILNFLHSEKELSVKDIVSRLKLSQATVSHHLAILKRAGVVSTRHDGTKVYYCLCCTTISRCCAKMQKLFGCAR